MFSFCNFISNGSHSTMSKFVKWHRQLISAGQVRRFTNNSTHFCSASIQFTIRVRRDLSESELCSHKSSPSLISHLRSGYFHHSFEIWHFFVPSIFSRFNLEFRPKYCSPQSSSRSQPHMNTLISAFFDVNIYRNMYVKLCPRNSSSSLLFYISLLSLLRCGFFYYSHYYGVRMCFSPCWASLKHVTPKICRLRTYFSVFFSVAGLRFWISCALDW